MLRGLDRGSGKSESDRELARCSPCPSAVLVAAGVELGEEGGGQVRERGRWGGMKGGKKGGRGREREVLC